MARIITEMMEYYHNKTYSTATKSLKLMFFKLIVTRELMIDLDRDDPTVEEVEIHMSVANCCFNDLKKAAGTSLTGEYFLEWSCLA